jgi:hypothetical protein
MTVSRFPHLKSRSERHIYMWIWHSPLWVSNPGSLACKPNVLPCCYEHIIYQNVSVVTYLKAHPADKPEPESDSCQNYVFCPKYQ